MNAQVVYCCFPLHYINSILHWLMIRCAVSSIHSQVVHHLLHRSHFIREYGLSSKFTTIYTMTDWLLDIYLVGWKLIPPIMTHTEWSFGSLIVNLKF